MRVMIFGRPGSGKSTYAYKLHQKTGLPLYHLDKYFYIDHWQERPQAQFLTIQENLVAQPAWIIDGNATKSLELRCARADIVLYFCYPRWLCLWRALKRSLSKPSGLDERAENCPEPFLNWKFIKYIWTFNKRVGQTIEQLQAKYPHVKFFKICNDQDLAKLSHVGLRI